jgi:hypothetical protein
VEAEVQSEGANCSAPIRAEQKDNGDADGEFLVAELAPDPEMETVVNRLSRELREKNLDLLTKVVSNFGVAASLRTLDEAHTCIAQGGMWVDDGSRKRTSSGVFLKLVVDQVSPEMKAAIWAGEKRKRMKRKQEVESKKIEEEIAKAWKIPCLSVDRVISDTTAIDSTVSST